MQKHKFFVDKVRLGKKGQITLPKKIRDEDGFREDDVFVITHMPGGSTILEKVPQKKTSADQLFDFLEKLPPFDAEKAWREVEQERAKEHR
ncbi:AbrB/MazE/SpoVT family DNA-binding domain-containing protein [Candidatus Woesearchaeota archaeon]|nr:AbrB/MazE/SpoVT family DNA-binding domain-containing protein [Candidatus Woesearchaeota archaeon]